MRTSCEVGTEKWVGWAQAKARQLRQVMANAGLSHLTRSFVPEVGVLVFMKLRPEGDFIRIAGGSGQSYVIVPNAVSTDVHFSYAGAVDYAKPTKAAMIGNPKIQATATPALLPGVVATMHSALRGQELRTLLNVVGGGSIACATSGQGIGLINTASCTFFEVPSATITDPPTFDLWAWSLADCNFITKSTTAPVTDLLLSKAGIPVAISQVVAPGALTATFDGFGDYVSGGTTIDKAVTVLDRSITVPVLIYRNLDGNVTWDIVTPYSNDGVTYTPSYPVQGTYNEDTGLFSWTFNVNVTSVDSVTCDGICTAGIVVDKSVAFPSRLPGSFLQKPYIGAYYLDTGSLVTAHTPDPAPPPGETISMTGTQSGAYVEHRPTGKTTYSTSSYPGSPSMYLTGSQSYSVGNPDLHPPTVGGVIIAPNWTSSGYSKGQYDELFGVLTQVANGVVVSADNTTMPGYDFGYGYSTAGTSASVSPPVLQRTTAYNLAGATIPPGSQYKNFKSGRVVELSSGTTNLSTISVDGTTITSTVPYTAPGAANNAYLDFGISGGSYSVNHSFTDDGSLAVFSDDGSFSQYVVSTHLPNVLGYTGISLEEIPPTADRLLCVYAPGAGPAGVDGIAYFDYGTKRATLLAVYQAILVLLNTVSAAALDPATGKHYFNTDPRIAAAMAPFLGAHPSILIDTGVYTSPLAVPGVTVLYNNFLSDEGAWHMILRYCVLTRVCMYKT